MVGFFLQVKGLKIHDLQHQSLTVSNLLRPVGSCRSWTSNRTCSGVPWTFWSLWSWPRSGFPWTFWSLWSWPRSGGSWWSWTGIGPGSWAPFQTWHLCWSLSVNLGRSFGVYLGFLLVIILNHLGWGINIDLCSLDLVVGNTFNSLKISISYKVCSWLKQCFSYKMDFRKHIVMCDFIFPLTWKLRLKTRC